VSIIADTKVRANFDMKATDLDGWQESGFPVAESGIGSVLRYFPVVDSTNRLARVWASGGGSGSSASRMNSAWSEVAPNGAVIIADHQTSGRGRQGRLWESSPGQNLLLTAIIRAQEPLLSDHVARGMLPLATSLAVSATIATFVGEGDVSIKWPNDVLLGGKKCAGILVEASVEDVFLIGIGLNVNESEFSDQVGALATSLLLHTGRRFDRRSVFITLMEQLNYWIPKVLEKGAQDVAATYTKKMAGMGLPITLNTSSASVQGILRGINGDGGLVVEHNSSQKVYYSGEVSLSHVLFE